MKYSLGNIGYYIRETIAIIRLNFLSNFFSLLSAILVFFILAMVVSLWWLGGYAAEAIQGEAEISVYFSSDLAEAEVQRLAENIRSVSGVRETYIVDEQEAYNRMEGILGKDAHVLEYFDENPFSSFIEIRINLNDLTSILNTLETMPGVSYIRENREILERLSHATRLLKVLGSVVVCAAAITALVIISHIIRLGIYNNREQIYTLRLLGAPETFIGIPFMFSGLMLTTVGGILAAVLAVAVIKQLYAGISGPLPFIPMPSLDSLLPGMILTVITASIVLGIIGSIFGLNLDKRV
jgi:cell division transport system permease protein